MFWLCIFVVSFAVLFRQRLLLSFCGPKTRDSGVADGTPPVFCLYYQKVWRSALTLDSAAAPLCISIGCCLAAKTARTAIGASYPRYRRGSAAQSRGWPGRGGAGFGDCGRIIASSAS